MEPLSIDGEQYTRLVVPDESYYLEEGKPELPIICRSVIVPDTLEMDIRVISSTYHEYEGIKIAPSKGNLLRTVNPNDVPYIFDEIYNQDTWYPQNIVELQEPYILRDFRGQVIVFNPFQYNPMTETLRFYTAVTVEMYPVGLDTVNCLIRNEPLEKIDSAFTQIYSTHFLNFFSDRYTPVEEQGNMLIITYNSFWNAMLPFYQWKILKGIPTEMVNVTQIGNANAIKTYIANYYNTKGLTYVLLVGDAVQVPPYMLGGSASDPSNTYVVGTDHYPDLFIGRFSAENTAQVDTQVLRSIEYERDPQPSGAWYHKGIGVASNQGAGTGDDGEADNIHIGNIRTQLLGYTYTLVDQIYDPSGTSAMVTTGLNDGRSIVNYCGHGSPTSWGSTGFSNTNVNALTNDNMLPFVFSVACNNGEFDGYTCFAEAWLRANHNGEPTGAIGALMSTISQSWAPPMQAQDEFANLTVQINPNNIKTTLGGLTANSCMSMNDKYGSAGTGETDYWTLFGDPSLQLRTDTPTSMTVNYNPVLVYGSTTYEVTVPGVKNALCALSYNGAYLGSGYTDSTGYALIEFDEPVDVVGDVDFVVTAYNKIPYITTVIVYVGDPPATPTTPDGPTFGSVGLEYTYSSMTIDPDGDQVFYQFNWGDGNLSEWVGPVDSEQTGSASHRWMSGGNYEVTCHAKDSYGVLSNWSAPLAVRIAMPEISIGKLRGGLASVSIEIMNIGDADVSNLPWTIDFKRYPFDYPASFNKHFAGNLSTVNPGATEKVTCRSLFGIGGVKITINVYGQEKVVKAVILGFFIIVSPK